MKKFAIICNSSLDLRPAIFDTYDDLNLVYDISGKCMRKEFYNRLSNHTDKLGIDYDVHLRLNYSEAASTPVGRKMCLDTIVDHCPGPASIDVVTLESILHNIEVDNNIAIDELFCPACFIPVIQFYTFFKEAYKLAVSNPEYISFVKLRPDIIFHNIPIHNFVDELMSPNNGYDDHWVRKHGPNKTLHVASLMITPAPNLPLFMKDLYYTVSREAVMLIHSNLDEWVKYVYNMMLINYSSNKQIHTNSEYIYPESCFGKLCHMSGVTVNIMNSRIPVMLLRPEHINGKDKIAEIKSHLNKDTLDVNLLKNLLLD